VACEPSSAAPKYLSALFLSGTLTGQADNELLERFASRRDENDLTAQLAFATLLARHGAMVMRVCRAVLGDRHEAEDAFQATFLVLASRAGSIRRGGSVGSWLYGVALRVSAAARSRAARRCRHERRFAEMTTRTTERQSENSAIGDDRDRVLHEEIGRLPDRFRAAVVMCYLEGMTHELAALQLGCPVGTIRSRLATARDHLRKRLTRRGVAPAVIPVGLLGSGLVSVSQSAALPASVPAALADATLHAALLAGLGKGALAGTVSTEAVVLMEGVLKTMMTTKLTLLAATVLIAGAVSAGAGLAAYSTLGRDASHATGPALGPSPAQTTPQKPEQRPTAAASPAPQAVHGPLSAQEVKQNMLRRSGEDLQALLHDYASDQDAFQKGYETAKTDEERKALQTRRHWNPAFYAGAFLELADRDPGTPPALEALLWIVTHRVYGSMPERAKEMIVRDHIRSDKIEPVFDSKQILLPGSMATERLFREALAKNKHRKIQGLACYYLARYLDYQASFVRLVKLLDSGAPMGFWGQDDISRLRKMDPKALEREAAPLYERVVKEFAELPLDPGPDRWLPGRPTNLGRAAQIYLDELTHLSVGQVAPEIEGVDLDGKPMKLSDYRGKVVALYFSVLDVSDVAPDTVKMQRVSPGSVSVPEVAKRHANEPFVLLGVATVNPLLGAAIPNPDRDELKKALAASGLPARFWFDPPDQNGKPGPIQTAWNANWDMYVLDHRGVIRYKDVLRQEFFENAVATLLKELADEKARSKKNN
jgi:RNA polymerase sigma factor (sigma-70 family)